MKRAMVVRWWVILLLAAVAVAVIRYRRQRSGDSAPAEQHGAEQHGEERTAGVPVARFQWGDAVDIADDSLGPARRGTRGLVVEVTDTQLLTYRVEFADGSTEIVRESALAPAEQAAG